MASGVKLPAGLFVVISVLTVELTAGLSGGLSGRQGFTGQSLLQLSDVTLVQPALRSEHLVDLDGTDLVPESFSGLELEADSTILRIDNEDTAEPTPVAELVGMLWHRWSPPPKLRQDGFREFFLSANLFYWCLFGAAMVLTIVLRVLFASSSLCQPTLAVNAIRLLVWLMLAMIYLTIISNSLGRKHGLDWLAGYILETVFMVENIFIFSMVIKVYKLPTLSAPRALLCVAVGQILFELVFFMGLAAWLRSFTFLPYMLGAWLTLCGFFAFFGDHEHIDDVDAPDATQSPTIRRLRSFRDFASESHAKLFVLSVCTLLLADFFLEIDVVLMKIQQFHNGYICFSSSALAVIALPELFFVGEVLLHKFALLKYGIAMILIIFGVEMLVTSFFKFELSPAVACCLVVGVLTTSIAFSAGHNALQWYSHTKT